jgi:acetylornithine deacetylase/succinyl-diaminopimelate desuccinylase-like protein
MAQCDGRATDVQCRRLPRRSGIQRGITPTHSPRFRAEGGKTVPPQTVSVSPMMAYPRVLSGVFRFALFATAFGSVAAAPLDLNGAHAEIVTHLKELVRIDTSNPPGNETKVAAYVRDLLAREGIAAEILEKETGRGNLVARLRGSGKARPILLMGHSDVVGVEREKWTVDPFGGVEKDGYIYGRGASDDKSGVATFLQVFLELKRQKMALDRDVILVIEAGEEATTEAGIVFLVQQHWAKIECEFALNEGGEIGLGPDGKPVYVGVATTEKLPRTMFLSAKGVSAHGSMPRPDNAVVRLAAAVAKLGAWQPTMKLNDTTRTFFHRLAAISPPEKAWLYTHLEDSAIGAQVQEIIRRTDFQLNSMLRTSISPTVLKAGFRSNVIPGDALATLDIRALPDEDMPAFIEQMKRVIDDPAVEITPSATSTRPAAPASRLDSAMFMALERAQKKIFPALVTLPEMLTGATDSAQLRAKGVQAYGVGPFYPADANRIHGNDERVAIAGLRPFFEIVWHAVNEVAAAK